MLGDDGGLEAARGEPALGLLRPGEARVHEQHAAARPQMLRRAIADAVEERAPVGPASHARAAPRGAAPGGAGM